jgi:hypothetical protein
LALEIGPDGHFRPGLTLIYTKARVNRRSGV